MASSFATVIDALRLRLEDDLTNYAKVTRGASLSGNVGAKPALQIRLVSATPDVDKFNPPKWSLGIELHVYGQAEQDDETMQDLAYRIEAALERRDGEAAGHWTNLGGACRWACPGGQVEFRGGALAGVASLVFPIRIEALPRRSE